MPINDAYRQLPAVDAVLRDPAVADLPRAVAIAVVRDVLAERRAIVAAGGDADPTGIAAAVVDRANRMLAGLRPVINATGVALHTNLGRAPWCNEAVAAAAAASQWCDLELDLDSGERSGRVRPSSNCCASRPAPRTPSSSTTAPQPCSSR